MTPQTGTDTERKSEIERERERAQNSVEVKNDDKLQAT